MSVSYFVRYDVEPQDVAAFTDYYRSRHVAVLARWPGLRRVTLHTPVEWHDSAAVNRGTAVLLAQLEFDSLQDLDRALNSPERAAARQDFENFPPYTGRVTHQAMATNEAWRRL